MSHQHDNNGRSLRCEFIAAPGAGKTAVADRLVDQAGVGVPRGLHSLRPIRVTITVCSMMTRRGHATAALRVAALIRRETIGTRRARMKRAWKVFRGLARIEHALHHDTTLVLDEGPVNWMLAVRWQNIRARAVALEATAAFYTAIGWCCVLLEVDASTLAGRIRERSDRTRAASELKPWRPFRPTRRALSAWWRGGVDRLQPEDWPSVLQETSLLLGDRVTVVVTDELTPDKVACRVRRILESC